jgi:hypothetical protein
MANQKERGEDLNPRDEDVDEKIRKLLDPDFPDEPTEETEPEASKIVSEKTTAVIKELDDGGELEKTAPELLPAKKGRKVIVPVSHDSDDMNTSKEGDPDAAEDEKPVLKISINDGGESNEDLAEKLDEVIAGLGEAADEEDPEDPPADPSMDDESEETDTPEEEPVTTVKVIKKIKKSQEEQPNEEDDLPEPEVVSSEDTEKAVRDIVAEESDDLLEIEDAAEKIKVKPRPKKKSHKKAIFKFLRRLSLIVLIVGIVGAMIVPDTRYVALNKAGVRSSSSLTVIDTTSQLPLKGAKVTLGGIEAETSEEGVVNFESLPLGETTLKIERLAFSAVEETLTIGWGSNPLGTKYLDPSGAQYVLQLVDFLSDKPVKGAIVDSDYAGSPSDKDGKAVLTLPPLEKDTIEVEISADGYRAEKVVVKLDSKEVISVNLVPSKKHAFVSKRGGNYDLYSVYADGKKEELILKASGNESDLIGIASHPTKNIVAFAATRSGNRSVNSVLLSDLMIVDLDSGDRTPVASSEKVQLLGWSGDNLVYFTDDRAAQKDNQEQAKLFSYDQSTEKSEQIASTSYFNDAMLVADKVYFAPAPNTDGDANLFVADSNGSNKTSLFNGEVWNIIRSSTTELSLYTNGGDWYSYKVGAGSVVELEGKPADQTGHTYLDSPDTKNSAWVDQRDGKGVLISQSGSYEEVITTATGITRPLAWLNSRTLVYRVDSTDETADYVVNLDGGVPLKINDVTNTNGIDSWYYY